MHRFRAAGAQKGEGGSLEAMRGLRACVRAYRASLAQAMPARSNLHDERETTVRALGCPAPSFLIIGSGGRVARDCGSDCKPDPSVWGSAREGLAVSYSSVCWEG